MDQCGAPRRGIQALNSLARLVDMGIRLMLGGSFAYAGIGKLKEPAVFADVIYTFAVLPHFLINPLAVSLPVLEVLVGMLLIFKIAHPAAIFLCILMLLVFLTVLAQAAARGIVVDCGCFGKTGFSSAGASLPILRDLVLLLLAFLVFYRSTMCADDTKAVQ